MPSISSRGAVALVARLETHTQSTVQAGIGSTGVRDTLTLIPSESITAYAEVRGSVGTALTTSSVATWLAVAHIAALLLAVFAIPIWRTHALEIAAQTAALHLQMARIGQAGVLPTAALLSRESTGALATVIVHYPRST